MYALAVIAIASGGVAAAIPLKDVHEVGVFFNQLAKPIGPRDVLTFQVGEHRVLVHPPAGYRLMQFGEGDPSHAHVTLVPVDASGGHEIVVRFEVPPGVDVGRSIAERDGLPVFAGRFGLLWRSADGFELLVSGADVDRAVLLQVVQTTEVS